MPSEMQHLRGVITPGVVTPLVTPLAPDNAFDLPALANLVDWLVAHGIHG